MNEIIILTGAIGSGKTTRLIDWAYKEKSVAGIASPVIRGKRMFIDLQSEELFPMEASPESTDTFLVGKFIFNKHAFKKAEQIIEQSTSGDFNYVVIDEVGPLELKDEGFSKILKKLLSNEKRNYNLVMVIREGILKNVLDHFGIKNHKNFEDL